MHACSDLGSILYPTGDPIRVVVLLYVYLLLHAIKVILTKLGQRFRAGQKFYGKNVGLI
jgi:hypothetical protein